MDAVRVMEKYFKGFTAIHIPRAQNKEAYKLAKAAGRKEPLPPDVFYEIITKPSTKQEKEKQINAILSEDWNSTRRKRRKKNVLEGKKLYSARR